jgi:hypothetical protein
MNRSGCATDMVKVSGCRLSQVARLGTGRRTETFTKGDLQDALGEGKAE